MNDTFSIVGIDPSTNFVGLANFIIDAKTFKILSIETTTINLANLIPPSNFNRQEYVSNYLYNFLINYFTTYPVLGLAIESAFINKFRISSYGPLTRIIQTIHLAYYTVYGYVNRIVEYAPLLVKKHIGKEFFIDKESTQNAIKNSYLNKFIKKDITEHEYDAIAITNLLYTDIINNKEFLLSI
jgi:Holliday junction resolvasome RuvABC endonuclease subunit